MFAPAKLLPGSVVYLIGTPFPTHPHGNGLNVTSSVLTLPWIYTEGNVNQRVTPFNAAIIQDGYSLIL